MNHQKFMFMAKYGTEKHIDDILKSGSTSQRGDMRSTVFENPLITEKHLERAMNDNNPYFVARAVKHHKTTTAILSKALDHPSYVVRRAALDHIKFRNDSSLHMKAIKHPDPDTADRGLELAKADGYLNREMLDAAALHPDHAVRKLANIMSRQYNDEQRRYNNGS